ncbi:hypothetical protein LCGC14_0541430 [marine sediment metagenome]|uniref:Zinc ribbon domain-containing protein n=1 Tax=marine sediment metagenome TaxID=412755 RepID=A0A0F9RXG7_9ZZZZ
MKKPTLKMFLGTVKFPLVIGLIAVGMLFWIGWIQGLVMLGIVLLFGYQRWFTTRVCCTCVTQVPYGSHYCPACGAKFIED